MKFTAYDVSSSAGEVKERRSSSLWPGIMTGKGDGSQGAARGYNKGQLKAMLNDLRQKKIFHWNMFGFSRGLLVGLSSKWVKGCRII